MSRLDKLRGLWSDSLLLSLPGVPDGFLDAGAIFDCCVTADPTPTHKYVSWILKSWASDCFLYEDICMGASSRIADQLKRFELYKRLLPSDMRSLMKYQSPGHLDAALNAVGAPFSLVSGKELKRDVYILGRMQSLSYDILDEAGNRLNLRVPLTFLSSQVLGRNTRWCTAGVSSNQFLSYTCKGTSFNPLYILELPDSSKYQFHWQFHWGSIFSFMDALDVKVSPGQISMVSLDAISRKLVSSGLRHDGELSFISCSLIGTPTVLGVERDASPVRNRLSLKTKLKCFSIYKRWFDFGNADVAYHEEASLLTKRYRDSFDGEYSLERYILDISKLLYIRGVCGFSSKKFASVNILNLFSMIEFRDADILYLKHVAYMGRRDILDLDEALDECSRQPNFDKEMFSRCLIPYLICSLGSIYKTNSTSVSRLGIHFPLSIFPLKSLVAMAYSPVDRSFTSLVLNGIVVFDRDVSLYGDNFLSYFEYIISASMYHNEIRGMRGPYNLSDLFSPGKVCNTDIDIQSFSRCLVLYTYASLKVLSFEPMSSIGFYNSFIALCGDILGFIKMSGFSPDDILTECFEAFECVSSLLDNRSSLYMWVMLFLHTLTHGKDITDLCECFSDELTRRKPEILHRSSQLLTELVIDIFNRKRFYGILNCIAMIPPSLMEWSSPDYPHNPILCFIFNNQCSRLPSQTHDFLRRLLSYPESRCQVINAVAATCLNEVICYGGNTHGYSLEALYNGMYSYKEISLLLSSYINFIETELNVFPSVLKSIPLVRETLEVISLEN